MASQPTRTRLESSWLESLKYRKIYKISSKLYENKEVTLVQDEPN